MREMRFSRRRLLYLLGLSAGVLACSDQKPVHPPGGQKPVYTPTPTLMLDSEQQWIKQHALPLTSTDPGASLTDLRSLKPWIGNASIVGLGEGSHGAHEFFTIKQRLLEFLVEEMGFTMFALEGSWSAGEKINQYVLTGQGNPQDLLRQFFFWTWNTHEILAWIEWIRQYNADPSHTQKVNFAGFDCQIIESNTYDNVVAYLQTVDPGSVATVSALYRTLRPDPTADMRQYLRLYNQLPLSTRQENVKSAQQVYALFTQNQAIYESRSSRHAFAQGLQEARIIVQGAQFLAYNENDDNQLYESSKVREAFMAENIIWLNEQRKEGSRLVLSAHDAHIQILNGSGYLTMGMFLRQHSHSRYLALGTSFYEGSFNSRLFSTNREKMRNEKPQPFSYKASLDSYNSTFSIPGLPLYALDLRHISDPQVHTWMAGPHPFLTVSEVFDPADDSFDYESLNLLQQFDVMIHINRITPSQLIPLR